MVGNNGIVIKDDPGKVREALCDLAALLWLKKHGMDTNHQRCQCYAISGERSKIQRMRKRASRQKDAIVRKNKEEGILVIASPETFKGVAADLAGKELNIREAKSHEVLKILKSEKENTCMTNEYRYEITNRRIRKMSYTCMTRKNGRKGAGSGKPFVYQGLRGFTPNKACQK